MNSVWIVTAQPDNWSSPGEIEILGVFSTEVLARFYANPLRYPDGSSRCDVDEWVVDHNARP